MVLFGILSFLISLAISAVIIYLATKMLGENKGLGTAMFVALIGSIIFGILGGGWIASLIGGIAWLIALGSLYNIGWLKSLAVAVVIWFFSAIVSFVLSTIF